MKILSFHTKRPWKSRKKIPEDDLTELKCTCGLKFDIIHIGDRVECPFCGKLGSYNRMVSNIGRRNL